MVNESVIDRWSTVHALNGLGMGLIGVSPKVAFGAALVYELGEYYHERHGSALFGTKRPETLTNIVGDTVLYAAAFFAGRSRAGARMAPLGAAMAFTAALAVTWVISPLGAAK